MTPASFTASLQREEAVLRFPYDEGLRMLLRAIPGRRWDPADRAWCIPVEPEQAEALARLFSGLPAEPQVSPQLEHVIARRRSRRRLSECLVDLARPDSDWWLSFATDAAAEPVSALLAHPHARDMPAIGRALVPLDDESVATLTGSGEGEVLRLSDQLRRALRTRSGEVQEREVAIGDRRGAGADADREGAQAGHEVQFRRDRTGEHWIVVDAARARHAEVLAAQAGLRTARAAGGAVGIAAIEHDAEQIDELIEKIEAATSTRGSGMDHPCEHLARHDRGRGPASGRCSCCSATRAACRRRCARRRARGRGRGVPLTLDSGG